MNRATTPFRISKRHFDMQNPLHFRRFRNGRWLYFSHTASAQGLPSGSRVYKMGPDGPVFRYTPEGITLHLDEQGLQDLAIMARAFQTMPDHSRRAVPGYAARECAVDELAQFIADAT